MSKTVAFSKRAVNIFFHILTHCNLSCRHCYINPAQHGRNMLPIDTIKRWLDAFSCKRETANIVFLGGEPTLHPQLSEAVKAARSMGYTSITIDTNGFLFHDILSRVTPSEVNYFSFSLDGATPQTNDWIRGEGSYDRCLTGIRSAVKLGFKTSLIFTVSNMNLHELEKMPSLIQTLGVDRFFIQVIGLRGKSSLKTDSGDGTHTDLQVSQGSWRRIIPKVAEASAELGITTVYPRVFLAPEEPFECAGLTADNYFVFPNGRVYRCPLCEDYPLHSLVFKDGLLEATGKINESDLFSLEIPEGCVMNKLLQPGNLKYGLDGEPLYRIACCMYKEEVG